MNLKPEDIVISTWQSVRQGGWNTTADRGVRIVHRPTGAMVQVDTERSQHKNKAVALKMLETKVEQILANKGLPVPSTIPPMPPVAAPVAAPVASIARNPEFLKLTERLLDGEVMPARGELKELIDAAMAQHGQERYEAGKRDGLRQYGQNLNRWANRAEVAEASLARLVEGIHNLPIWSPFNQDVVYHSGLLALLPAKADSRSAADPALYMGIERCNPSEVPQCAAATPAPAMGEELPQVKTWQERMPEKGDEYREDTPEEIAMLEEIAELRACMALRQQPIDRTRIRAVFMAHGFTVKEGQTDLKEYVYQAAEALLALRQPSAEKESHWMDAKYSPREIPNTPPEPFILGNQYRTQGGRLVRFVGIANEGNSYETMCDELGHHRYTRRDFGRGTGAPWNDDCVPPLYTHPAITATAPVSQPAAQEPLGYVQSHAHKMLAAGHTAMIYPYKTDSDQRVPVYTTPQPITAPAGSEQERVAFEAWYAKRHPKPVNDNPTWAHASKMDDLEVWNARAALAAQQKN